MPSPITLLNRALEARYRIEGELGAGGMATVYLADDLKHDRKVAMKVLKPELAAIVGAERFLAEIKTTANLQHPHILPLFDSGEADGFLFFVMPFVEGESLRDRLDREKQLPVAEAVKIASEVADALAHAHAKGVIHRDIKPANILLRDGRVQVADFGIALAVQQAGGTRLTETGLSVGTPHYMSPEQASGDRELDGRSDVYSLGCVLYEMLAGSPPHTGSSAQAIILKIIADTPRPVEELRKSVPPNIAVTVAIALEKLPADRLESAKRFADALANPALFGEARSPGTTAPPPGERSWAVPVLAVSTILLGALAAWGWLGREVPAERQMILTETLIPMETEEEYGINLALSPDASKLAYATAVDGTTRLWVLDRTTLQAKPLLRTEDANAASFSPDGQQVAFVTNQFELKVASLQGEAGETYDIRAARSALDWGHDGYIYFAEGRSGPVLTGDGISRLSPATGVVESLTEENSAAGEISHLLPHLLPSGNGVLFTISRDRLYEASAMDIAVVDLRSRISKVLLKGIVAKAISPDFLLVVTAEGTLLGVPFDGERLEVTGTPMPLAGGVGVERFGMADLAVSAAGTVVFGTRRPQERELVWMDRTGGVEPLDPEWVRLFTAVSLAPDGHALAVSVFEGGLEQMWVREVKGSGPRPLRLEGGVNARIRTWTPDSRYVAFWRDYAVSVLSSEGGTPTDWVQGGFPRGISFTPGGSEVAFNTSRAGQMDIYLAEAGDSLGQPLVATEAAEHSPAFSPDGRWLAYVSDDSGRDEVYVRRFPPSTDGTRWAVSTDGGASPTWALDGSELYFVRRGEMMAVEVSAGSTFAPGPERGLFSLPGLGTWLAQYDVAPDGRFLVLRPVGGAGIDSETVVVAENVLNELRARQSR